MQINTGYLVVYSLFFATAMLILQKMGASHIEALVTINVVIGLIIISKSDKQKTSNK